MHWLHLPLYIIKNYRVVIIFALLGFVHFSTFAQSSSLSVGSETYQPATSVGDAEKNSTAQLRHPAGPVAYPRIILQPLSTSEKQAAGESSTKQQRVGLGRHLSDDADFVTTLLDWQSLADGSQVASFVVKSTDAQALRVQFLFTQLPEGMELRFYDPRQSYETLGPVASKDIADADSAPAVYWSPTMPGDSIGVEIYLPAVVDPDSLQFSIPMLSHLFSSWQQDSTQDAAKNLADIGAAGFCHIDVACVSGLPQSIVDSVAKYEYTDIEGDTFLCTGTLIADNEPGSFTPYFLTANHCISSQPEAASMELYWFFQRASCNGPNPLAVTRQTGGADLFSTATENDYTLLRLRQNPPAGVGLTGWNSTPLAGNSPVFSIHHPLGDLKKFSEGTALGFAPFLEAIDGSGPYIYTEWLDGVTEPGSSGAGLWLETNSEPLLVGVLAGGSASCTAPDEPDYYGRFDQIFPLIEPWLNPAADALSTVWWDASRSGQAVQLVQDNQQISGAWYLYDESGQGMWVTFVSALNGTTVNASLLRYTGPALGTPWNDNAVQFSVAGTVAIDFTSAQSATFSYTLNGVSDTLNLQPFNPQADGAFTKVWWNPNRSGQAVQILQENNQISGAWYVYDETGQGLWTTFSGALNGNSVTTDLFRFNGPALGSVWDENQVSSQIAGTITLNFQSQTSATMSYTLNGISDGFALQPFNP